MYNEFYSQREIKKTKKQHCCEACGSVIAEESNVLYCAGKSEGNFWTCYMHKECNEIYKQELHAGDYDDGLAFQDAFENVCFWGENERPRLELMKQIPNPSKFLLSCIDDFEQHLSEKKEV